MKKVFMEPELKVTKFEYEDFICSSGNVDVGTDPDVPDNGVDGDWWR